jgi:small subunit ribosomal protein S16
MPTRMRLQRHGKKGRPFYHIVIADGRAPRDGKFIERLGTYNPLTNPADINIDFDLTLNWLMKGADPTETVRAILSYKGVLYKYHLKKGVLKGALTEEQVEAKFNEWLAEKESKVNQKKRDLELAGKEGLKKRMEAETKVNMAKSEAIAKKLAKAAEEETAQEEEAMPETDQLASADTGTEPEVSSEPEAEQEVAAKPETKQEVAAEPETESPEATPEPENESPKPEEEGEKAPEA